MEGTHCKLSDVFIEKMAVQHFECSLKKEGTKGQLNIGKTGLSKIHPPTIYTGVSIWRYGAKNSASENFLAPRAVFAAPDNAAAGNYELSDSLERPCSQRTL